jgi:hypothetical protein
VRFRCLRKKYATSGYIPSEHEIVGASALAPFSPFEARLPNSPEFTSSSPVHDLFS